MKLRYKSLLICLLLAVGLLSVIPVTLAQRTTTYVSPDEDWQVEVPRGFDTEENRDGTVNIVGDEFEIQFFGPVVLEDLGYRRIKDPQDLIETYADDEGYEITELDFSSDVDGIYVVVYGKGRVGYVAIAKVFTNDKLGMALITVQKDAGDTAFSDSFTVVGTFNAADGDVASNNGGTKSGTKNGNKSEPVAKLRDFDGDWEDAIAELEDEGMIASGGDLVFAEDSAFVASDGFTYTPIAKRSNVQNVVIAGELTFDPDGREFQACALAARVETNSKGGSDVFMEVGFDTDGNLFVFDRFDTGENDYIDETIATLDEKDPHHILALIVDDTITVYLDGELVGDPVQISKRSGSFGIMMLSKSRDSRCDGANLWAYSIPASGDVCEATSTGDINKREGPGTGFDRAGRLSGNTPTEVIAFAEGDDDFIWYQLDDETWVREDLITLSGPCDDLPEEK